jgi:hypothetical protein
MGRGWLVRGRSIGGSRVRAHAEGGGVRAWQRLVRGGSARARTLGPTLRTRGAASRPSVWGDLGGTRAMRGEEKPKKNVDLYVQTVSSSEQGFVVVCA